MGRAGNSRIKPFHFHARRIVRPPDTKQNFELRILLECVGADRFVEARVFPVDRFQDGNGQTVQIGARAGWRR